MNSIPALSRAARTAASLAPVIDVSSSLNSALIVQLGVVTEPLNRRWYETNTGEVLKDVQRWVKHPILSWMAATLDGVVERTEAVFEAKFMLPWAFSEEAAAEKHMAQLQHKMWVVGSKQSAFAVCAGRHCGRG
jgi:predicted phage-related endonuclease